MSESALLRPRPGPVDAATLWNGFWFRPEAPTNLAVARIVIALSALWVVLSRRDLPSLFEYPSSMWRTVPPERRLRFLLVVSPAVERALWITLHLALLLTIVGLLTRWAALLSAILLYHFAPLETIFRTGNPYLLGFTTPCVALIAVAVSQSGGAFLRRGRDDADWVSWRHRWPVAMCEFLLCWMYFFAGYSKLVTTGLAWLDPRNIRNYILAINQALGMAHRPGLGLWIADHPVLCGFVSVTGLSLELLFPFVLVVRRGRIPLVVAMVIFHLLNFLVFRIAFQSILLLLVFIDWQALVHERRMTA